DQDLGAGLEIGRFQKRLLLGRSVGGHHRQRADQCLVGRVFDALPVGLEIVGCEKIRQRPQQARAVDVILAFARREIVDEGGIAHAALSIGRRYGELFVDVKAGNAGELEGVAALAGLGALGDAADADDPVTGRRGVGLGVGLYWGPGWEGSGWIMPMRRCPARKASSIIAA